MLYHIFSNKLLEAKLWKRITNQLIAYTSSILYTLPFLAVTSTLFITLFSHKFLLCTATHSAAYLPICCPSIYLLFPRREECGFWTLLSLVNKLPSLRDVQNLTFHTLLQDQIYISFLSTVIVTSWTTFYALLQPATQFVTYFDSILDSKSYDQA